MCRVQCQESEADVPCDGETGLDACPFQPSPGKNELLPENLEAWQLYHESRVLGWEALSRLRDIPKDDETLEKLIVIEDFMANVNKRPEGDG